MRSTSRNMIQFSFIFPHYIKYNLDLKYTISGHFTSSPYCVVLQVKEMFKRKTHYENSTVCIYTDVSQVYAAEILPQPAKLRAKEKNKKMTDNLITSSSSTPLPNGNGKKVSQKQTFIIIEYPTDVIVLQNASYFSRVAEPLIKFSDTKIR